MAFSIGVDAKAYRNTGTFSTPVWDEMANVQDVTQSQGAGEAEIKVRGNAYAQYKRGIIAASVSLSMGFDPADADFQAVRDAHINHTLADMQFLDAASATSTAQGLRAEWEVMDFERSEGLEDGLAVTFTLKPGISTNAPSWTIVA